MAAILLCAATSHIRVTDRSALTTVALYVYNFFLVLCVVDSNNIAHGPLQCPWSTSSTAFRATFALIGILLAGIGLYFNFIKKNLVSFLVSFPSSLTPYTALCCLHWMRGWVLVFDLCHLILYCLSYIASNDIKSINRGKSVVKSEIASKAPDGYHPEVSLDFFIATPIVDVIVAALLVCTNHVMRFFSFCSPLSLSSTSAKRLKSLPTHWTVCEKRKRSVTKRTKKRRLNERRMRRSNMRSLSSASLC